MTSDRPDDQPLDGPLDTDELAVLAVLDGDATAEQRRRVARDPELVGRLRAAEAAVAAVRERLDGPGDDVLDALRARAVAAWDDEAPSDDHDDLEPDDGSSPDPDRTSDDDAQADAPPVRPATDELAARRARRPARRLPPLPAVAAVVILLVVVGIGLLVSGNQSSEDAASDAAATADAESGGGADGGSESAEDATAGAASEGPADAARAALLARATASYTDDESLFTDLRQVDPTTLDLATADEAAPTTAPPSTTTAPPAGDSDDATTTTAAAGPGADGRVLAEDGDVVRCDTVMRSAEPDLEPATAAVFVSVDGVPVVILSNPVPATDDGPATTRLTALNALDCSPRGAVQR